MFNLLGFERGIDGCGFDVPTIQSIALWRSLAELARGAGFRNNGQRCAEFAERMRREQREVSGG